MTKLTRYSSGNLFLRMQKVNSTKYGHSALKLLIKIPFDRHTMNW